MTEKSAFNPFDLNRYGRQMPELQDYAEEAVTVALGIIATRKTASPTSQLAALQAARVALFSLVDGKKSTTKTLGALETLASAIMQVETTLRVAAEKERKKEKKKGGAPFKGASLHQRMAVKLAVDWLAELSPPMSVTSAATAVAACIPDELVTMASARKQVEEWRDAYKRQKKGSRRNRMGARYMRALADVKFDRFEKFEEHWRIGGECEGGGLGYTSYACERTPLHASREEVLAWVRSQFTT